MVSEEYVEMTKWDGPEETCAHYSSNGQVSSPSSLIVVLQHIGPSALFRIRVA
jgi:hypothetical protein